MRARHFVDLPTIEMCLHGSARWDAAEQQGHPMCTQEEKMSGVPLIVFANKQDLVGAMSADEIADELNLTSIRDRPWQIQACSAKQGTGLTEGMEWLMKMLR